MNTSAACPQSNSSRVTRFVSRTWPIGVILAVGIGARLVLIVLQPQRLVDDRDAYLALASGWRETGTFGLSGEPTAYRPPVYPWLLSLVDQPCHVWIAGINLASAIVTVLLTWLTAQRWGWSREASLMAAALPALDPLLLNYAGLPMTESLGACWSAVLLWLLAAWPGPAVPGAEVSVAIEVGTSRTSRLTSLVWPWLIGLVCGVSILTRPTFLIFAGLLFVSVLAGMLRNEHRKPVRFRDSAGLLAGMLLPVLLWGWRNHVLLGSFVMTTTHGGYTLLLGNNEAFYREVVVQPLGTVWDGSRGPGQAAWSEEVQRRLAERNLTHEVERDRALRDEAIDVIQHHPGLFLRACLLRLIRLWNVVPSGEASEGWPGSVLAAVAIFYLLWWGAALTGTLRMVRDHDLRLVPTLCLVVAFMLVHLVYWSNVRMRAPLVPALALLAGYCLTPRTADHALRAVSVRETHTTGP